MDTISKEDVATKNHELQKEDIDHVLAQIRPLSKKTIVKKIDHYLTLTEFQNNQKYLGISGYFEIL